MKRYNSVVFLKVLALLIGLISGYLFSNSFKTTKKEVKISPTLAKHHQHSIETHSDDHLFDQVRIACLVMTYPGTHESHGHAIRNTWGRKCNKLVFVSTIEARSNDTLGVMPFAVPEGKKYLWLKAKEMLLYAYYNLMDEVDWFYKADDDTYAVMENLRYFLYPFTPDYPISFGYRLKFVSNATNQTNDYYSGGAGYVMSKAALKKVVEDGILKKDGPCLKGDIGNEDLNVGNCLRRVGVVHGTDVDVENKPRFQLFPLSAMMTMDMYFKNDSWYWKFVYYKPRFVSCKSRRSASNFSVLVPYMLTI